MGVDEKKVKVLGNTAHLNPETGDTHMTLLVQGILEHGVLPINFKLTPVARKSWIEGLLEHHEEWEDTPKEDEDG